MDLEEDLRELLVDELAEHTTSPEGLANVETRDLLGAYGNWGNRFPSVQPRTVHRSRELARLLRRSGALAADVRKVLAELESGADIEFRLSKDVEVAWAPPDATRREKLWRLDRYLAAWGIHHLHLGPPNPSTGRAQSSDLLYVVFVDDEAYALAARPHRAWLRDELLHIAADNWPDGGPLLANNFVVGLEREHDEASRAALFQSNIVAPFTRNSRVYFARDQVSLAGTSHNAGSWANQTYYDLQRAIKRLEDDPDGFVAAMRRRFPEREIVSPTWKVAVRNREFVLVDSRTDAHLRLSEVVTARG